MTQKSINPTDVLKKENAKLLKENEKLKEKIKSLEEKPDVNPKANTLFKAKIKRAGVK